jgi:phytoene desaturase
MTTQPEEIQADVVIIGSGLSGLIAGALLTATGRQVLVIERKREVGGRATSATVKGFSVPTGTIGFEVNGIIEQIFEELGITYPVIQPVPHVRYWVKGAPFVLPAKGATRAVLRAAAPSVEEADAVHDLVVAAMISPPPEGLSTDDWLSTASTDPDVLGIFRRLIPAIHGITTHELQARDFANFLVAMRGYSAFGFGLGGSRSVPHALAQYIRDRGGQVMASMPARSIEVAGERVAAVLVTRRSGERLRLVAREAYISNMSPRATAEMVGSANLPRDYLNRLAQMRPPAPVCAVYYISDEPFDQFVGITIPTRSRCMNTAVDPCLTTPEIAPPGKHLLMTLGAPEHTDAAVDWAALEADLMADAADIFPSAADAQILTRLHYRGEWPLTRAWTGDEAPQTTPLTNLVLVGDAAKPSGFAGTPACAASARVAVELITAS